MTTGIASHAYLNELPAAEQIACLEQLYMRRRIQEVFTRSQERMSAQQLEIATRLIREYPGAFILLPRLDLDDSVFWPAIDYNGRPQIRWIFPLEEIGKLNPDVQPGNILLYYTRVMQDFFITERRHFQENPWWLWIVDHRKYGSESRETHPLLGVPCTTSVEEIFAPDYNQPANKAALAQQLNVPVNAIALPRLIDVASLAYHRPLVKPLPKRIMSRPYDAPPKTSCFEINIWLEHRRRDESPERFIAHIDRRQLRIDPYRQAAAPASVIAGISLARAVH